MRRIALTLAFVLSGCSASLVERLSTDKYWYHSRDQKDEVHVSEHPIGSRDHFGYNKRMIIHNPLTIGIRARVKCSSMFQADGWYHVNARSVRYILITGTREFDQTCFLDHYEADDTYVRTENEQ